MAQAPTPKFSQDNTQPVIIQNKMPKAGETDVTGQLGGGGGANNTFRLLGNNSTAPATTTSSGNPYPVGYTSGIPQGYDTVSGPGASYNPGTSNQGGNTPGGGNTGGNTGATDPKGGMFINPNPWTGDPRGTGTIPYTAPVNNPGTYNPNDIGRGIGWGYPNGYDPNTPSPGTTGGPQPGFGQPRNGGSSTPPPPVGDPGPKGGNMTTGGQQSQSYAQVGAGGMPVQYGAMSNSMSGGATNNGGKPGGDGSPYLGPPGGGGTAFNPPRAEPGNNPWQPNLDRFRSWHAGGSNPWYAAPGRGPAAPTWLGGSYNPWTGQGGGGGGTPPPPPGGKDPVMGGINPGLMSSQTTGTQGGFNPTQNHPNYPGTGYGSNWTSGPFFQIPQGWNTSGPPGPSQQGGNYTPPGPDYQPPGKTEVGGNAVRVGVPRPNDQGAQRGWRYDQAGQPIYNDQLPPVGGDNMAARGAGYLGPPVQQNFPPFPPFDPQNPPTPQQWLAIVQQWMSQFSGDGRPNQWQGMRPSNPIENPTWGAPWPGWNRGDDLRNYPPSRPPGGTR